MFYQTKLSLNKINEYKNIINNLIEGYTETKNIPTFKGNKKEYLLNKFLDKLKSIEFDLVELIKNKINFKNIYSLKAWNCIGSENCYFELHRHNQYSDNKIATITYLDVPKGNGGEFYYVENNDTKKIKPEVGTVLMFSNHLLHGSYPQEKGIRQTFNMDFEYNA